nr:response regulator [Paenactinomyces guangxiensis]
MLVDDERNILEGIAGIIDWESLQTVLAGTARNGLDAYEQITRDQPDIVISDIKMPGMDGLELVSKVYEDHPQIRFILLSGFGEFDYAKKAMQYGVKHYLLKPCNENKIKEALQELVGELKERERKEQFIKNMKHRLKLALPHVKEQFLKEFVTNKTYGVRDWEYYRKLFNLNFENRKVRLVLFHPEGSFEFEHIFAVKNIAEEILGVPVLSSIVGEYVLILVEDIVEPEELHERIHAVRNAFFEYYKIDITIALSEAGDISDARRLYTETLECLNYRFYLGEGSLITKKDITHLNQTENVAFSFNEEQFYMFVKSGRWEDANREMNEFFANLANLRLDMHITKSYVIQLFVAMIRLCESEQMNGYMAKISMLIEMETLEAMRSFFRETAKEITMSNYKRNKNKQSAIISKVVEIIHEQLGNSELSLTWVANEMIYMNADYLGKLFKKVTGDRFSSYVTKVRIEKAKEVIEQSDDVKIFELAEMFGFKNNPQYFSQVFKKYVGCTPTEYRKHFDTD